LFEIATKYRIGKLPEFATIAREVESILAKLDYEPVPVEMMHALEAGRFDIEHKDPFDRLLIAQARTERVPMISNEASSTALA
jgi:PIN domain nuclease of toxin-antitoxin system